MSNVESVEDLLLCRENNRFNFYDDSIILTDKHVIK